MVAGAGVRVHAEAFAHHALPSFDRVPHQRLDPALAVELALACRNDHLRAALGRGQRLPQQVPHLAHAVGAVQRADPFHAHAVHRRLDRVLRRAVRVVRLGREDVLPAGRRGVSVVHDQQHVVGLVEHGVAHAAGQPVVPEAAIAHHADGAAVRPRVVQRRGPGPTEPVTHRGVADVEGRQDGEQVTTDVAGDVMRSKFAFHQLHRGEDRPLRATGAERRRAAVHRHRGHCRFRGRGGGERRQVTVDESAQPGLDHRRGVLAGHRQHVLAVHRRLHIRPAQDGVQRLLDVFGLAFLHHQHRALTCGELDDLRIDQWVGDVHHVERDAALAIRIGQA